MQFIYDEYNKRTSMKSIKSLLELNQVKTRRGNTNWTLGSLQLMLRNELYTGVDVFYDKKIKQTITNSVPVIIPLKIFNAAKERRLKILERKGQMNRTKKFYLLRDFMICGSCKTPMGGRIKKDRCEQMYYCPLSERKFNNSILDDKVCTMKRGLNIPSTDKEVWDVITKVISNTTEIKNRFISGSLLGSGLSSKEIKAYKKECGHKLDELNNDKKHIEGAIIKIETKFALGEYASQEVYNGIKKDLNTKYKAVKIKIETINGEIGQLGNQQQWLDWIDEFGADILSAKDLTDEEKKGIINAVVRDILVNYDQAEKRHHLRINFRLPVLSTLGGILKENDAVLKRGKNAVKISESAESIDNTGAPEHHRSELLYSHTLGQVAGLVHVAATHDGYVVGQQLQWHYGDEWREYLFGFGYFNDVICEGAYLCIALMYHGYDLAFAGFHFLYIRYDLLVGALIGS